MYSVLSQSNDVKKAAGHPPGRAGTHRMRKASRSVRAVAVGGFVLAAVFHGQMPWATIMGSESAAQAEAGSNEMEIQAMKKEILSQLRFDWGLRSSGAAGRLHGAFDVFNPTPHAIERIEICALQFAEDGREIGRSYRTLDVALKPGGRARGNVFDMGIFHRETAAVTASVAGFEVRR